MILEQFSLEVKTAIITGGGSGLGREIALAMARAGADVAVTARHLERLEETAAEVRKLGKKSLALSTDVTRSDQVNRMVERVISEFGKVDIMVNNAGSGAPRKPIWEISDQEWREGIDTNLTGAFYCCRAVSRHMVERQQGNIINVASGYGLRGDRNLFMYSCGKAGTILLTRSLALTWARDGIRVNSIVPGWFATMPRMDPEVQRFIASRAPFIPVGRPGHPEEIGPLAVYLASDASSYVTGQIFLTDGGGLVGGFAPTHYGPIVPI